MSGVDTRHPTPDTQHPTLILAVEVFSAMIVYTYYIDLTWLYIIAIKCIIVMYVKLQLAVASSDSQQ